MNSWMRTRFQLQMYYPIVILCVIVVNLCYVLAMNYKVCGDMSHLVNESNDKINFSNQ